MPNCLECYRSASFNLENNPPRFCKTHKSDLMVDTKHKKCLDKNCIKNAGFNYKDEKTLLYCGKHKKSGMLDKKHKYCEYNECIKRASFNFAKMSPKFCGDHKAEKMQDVRHQKCISCGLFRAEKRSKYLCSYCNTEKSHKFRTKENEIKELLEKNNIKFINNKSYINDCCLKYRPDFLIELPRYFLILEVDEFAHKHYEKECELIRMNNIASTLGLPVKFIRYNPDNKIFKKEIMHKTLIETINEVINNEFYEDFSVTYLYY